MGGVSLGGVVVAVVAAVFDVCPLDESMAEMLWLVAVVGTVGDFENMGEFVALANASERAL